VKDNSLVYSGDFAILMYIFFGLLKGGEGMYRKILVPLDGSKLAECVLPHVETAVKGCSPEEVILISVTERIPVSQVSRDARVSRGYQMLDLTVQDMGGGAPAPDVPMPQSEPTYVGAVGRKYKQAQRYLERIAKQLKKGGISVRTEVLLGSPAEQIADYATHNEVDLVIMATHGKSGISRWVMGSVSDRVLRSACVAVLMVRAPGCVPGI